MHNWLSTPRTVSPVSPDGDLQALGPRRGAGAVHRLGEHAVDVHRGELGQRFAALQPGQVDELAHEPAQPVGLVRHPAGEPLDGLGVVGRLLDRLGQQGQRADRGLQLVPDVGHEVPAHRLRATGLGDVLQHQRDRPGRRRRPAVQPDPVHARSAEGRTRPGLRAGGRPRGGCRRPAPLRPDRAGRGRAAALPRTMPSARAAGLASSTASSTSTRTTAGSIRSSSRRASAASGRPTTATSGAGPAGSWRKRRMTVATTTPPRKRPTTSATSGLTPRC